MSHPKKYQSSWRCGICDICLGLLTVLFPIILLQNFLYAFCYIFLLSTVSSVNAISVTRKNSFLLSSSLNNFDDNKYEKTIIKKIDKKVYFFIIPF